MGNVRALNNLKNNLRRNGILLRALERGVYVKNFSRSLPKLLLTLPHSLLTEAIALMMGHLTLDENWLRLIARLPGAVLATRLPKLGAKQRQKKICFSRLAFITSHFGVLCTPAQIKI